jgi:uncharacterized circularly permuted ATP-grasp superfamily protein
VIDGSLEPRHADLRRVSSAGGLLPGGLRRIARGAGELVVQLRPGRGRQGRLVLPD